MSKKNKSLWRKISSVFTKVVNWVATLFGMNDNSKFSRVMRRIVSSAFALLVIFCLAIVVLKFCNMLYWGALNITHNRDDGVYLSEQLTDDLYYYEGDYAADGYIIDGNDKKVLKGVMWIAKPLGDDSLVCYCDGDYRGYFHLRDGHTVVKPTYDHAWIFSCGLAAVEKNHYVQFIDTTGKVAIDKSFGYNEDVDGYVFHNGHCAVHDSTSQRMGLIDCSGTWVLYPQYERITPIDSFWILKEGDEQSVITHGLDVVLPMTKASFEILGTDILATFADHTLRMYSLKGELVTSSLVYNVEQLMYDTREVVYPDRHDDEDGYYNDESFVRQAVATCWRYEAEYGWYGLMSPNGHLLTPPSYARIVAIDKDLYLCEDSSGRGVMLNSKGVRVH